MPEPREWKEGDTPPHGLHPSKVALMVGEFASTGSVLIGLGFYDDPDEEAVLIAWMSLAMFADIVDEYRVGLAKLSERSNEGGGPT